MGAGVSVGKYEPNITSARIPVASDLYPHQVVEAYDQARKPAPATNEGLSSFKDPIAVAVAQGHHGVFEGTGFDLGRFNLASANDDSKVGLGKNVGYTAPPGHANSGVEILSHG